MAFMQIFIIFNFWLVHNTKDTLIVASHGSGAETISFIKMWVVFPVSIAFVMLYAWLSNRLRQRTLFYGIITTFALVYALFAFVLYPNRILLNMSPETLNQLQTIHPHLKWFFPMIGYWVYTLFYAFSEMWAAVVLTLLFWQFANQITPVQQAKRFYMMYGTFSAFGMMAAGGLTKYLNRLDLEWSVIFQIMMGVVVLNCVIVMCIYHWVNAHVVTDAQRYHPEHGKVHKNMEIKLSLFESFKHIIKSDYLVYIAILAIAYNISINIVEITWKSQLKIMFPTKRLYSDFMGDFNLWLAGVMFVTGIIGVNVVRKFSWYASALVTPIVMLITSTLFFGLTLYGEFFLKTCVVGMSPILASSWMGLIQNLSARSTKFSFFNATREMAYIPLDAELKIKGKAAIDVLSGRVGKLGGSALQQILLIIVGGTQLMIAPYLAIILVLIIICWVIAVGALNQRFTKLAREKAT